MASIYQLLLGPNLAILVAAMALLVGGLALIASSVRDRDQIIARRVAMVGPVAVQAEKGTARGASPDYLIRLQTKGTSAADRRRIIRFFARFGVTADRAM